VARRRNFLQGMGPFGGRGGGQGGSGYDGDFIGGGQPYTPNPGFGGPSQYGPSTPGYGEFGAPGDPNMNPMQNMWSDYMNWAEGIYSGWGDAYDTPWADIQSDIGYLQDWVGGYGAPNLHSSLSTNPWGGGQGLFDMQMNHWFTPGLQNYWDSHNYNPLARWSQVGGQNLQNPMLYRANPQSYATVGSEWANPFYANNPNMDAGDLPGAFIGGQLATGGNMGMRDLISAGLPSFMSEGFDSVNFGPGANYLWDRGEMPTWDMPEFLDPYATNPGGSFNQYLNQGDMWSGMSDLLYGASGNPTDIWSRPEGWSDLLGDWGYGTGQHNYSNMANWSVDWDAIQDSLSNRRGGRNNIGTLSNYAMGV
jgi:hypothetical protein